MSEQAGLLQAICEHPDDHAHRLVYADWLEDHGDSAQADYIRAEVALAGLPEYDPAVVRRRRAFRDRNSAPQARPESPPLPEGLRWDSEYRGGFPWRLMVFDLAVFIREAPHLLSQAPFQALDIDARTQLDISPLLESPWLERFTRLEFSLGEFGTSTIQKLLDSPYLSRLNELVFEFAGIRGSGLRLLLTSPLARRLRGLGLRSNFFTDYGVQVAEAFHEIEPLPTLEWLDLADNRIGELTLRSLRGRTPVLNSLDISGNQLPSDAFEMIAANLGGLHTLRLAKTMPGVIGIERLGRDSGLGDNLRLLDLGGNKLGPVAMKSLAKSKFSGLRVLGLRNNPVNDSGAAVLAQMPGLVSLDLCKTGLSDRGARVLLDSPNLSGLIHLDLHDNLFSPSVVEEIRERFGHFSASDPKHVSTRKPRSSKE